jgi:small subunit ribosomal protein S4
MARYTGPRQKKSRRYGTPLFGPSKALERRNFPPGVHGEKGNRKKSDYATGLAEKQKLRIMYGLLEKQFRGYFEEAARRRGVTGENLLQILELRLDNVVFRLGFANSRRAARQMVTHGHIKVNGRKANSPSFQTKPGHVIEGKATPVTQRMVTKGLELTQIAPTPEWLTVDKEHFKGEVKRVPSREEIAPIVNEQLVVEFYSR